MLEHYHRQLGQIRRELELLHDLATHAREPDLATRAQAALARVMPRPFRIAFVGEFKSGKSTLVNALAGTEALPVATRECTTLITRVRADPRVQHPTAQARTTSGGERELTLEEATALLQQRDGDDIVEIELGLPVLPGLGQDVELVDTPGSGAAGRVRELVTLAWLPNADAVVFVTRADQLLSASELAFLRDSVLAIDPTGVFVVVNRKDEVATRRARQELEERLHRRLVPVLGESFRAFWTCAADAMDAAAALREVYDELPDPADLAEWEDSGVPELRAALARFLAEERVTAELERHRRAAERIAAELDTRLDLRLRRFRMDGEAVARRAERARSLEAALLKERGALCQEVELSFRGKITDDLRSVIDHAVAGLRSRLRDEEHARARRMVASAGDRGLARMQATLLTGWRQVQDVVLARLVAFDARDGFNAIQAAGVRWSAGDLGAALQLQIVKEETLELAPSPPQTPEQAAAGATLGSLLGFALAGPAGGLIGGWIGFAYTQASSGPREVRRAVEVEQIDVGATLADFEHRLSAVATSAIATAEGLTLQAIHAVIDERLADLRARAASLFVDEPSLDQRALQATREKLRELDRRGERRRAGDP